MEGKREPRRSSMLKAPAALVAAVAVRRGLHVGWKLVTGKEPPADPEDKQVPLGQAVAWAALFGAAVAGARMIARRYVSTLLVPRRQRQGLSEPAAGQIESQGHQLPQAEAPGLPYLIPVAVLAWRRRR
jgi:hypothetical protein